MPTRLRCIECGEKYYTARGEYYITTDFECERCSGKLVICKDWKQVIESDLVVRLIPNTTRGNECRARVRSLTTEEIELSALTENYVPTPGTACRVHFFRREPALEGRYFFHTEVVDRRREKDPVVVARPPGEVMRLQERRSLRMSVRFPVKYQVICGESGRQVKEIHSSNPRTGHALNISDGGLLLTVDPKDSGGIREDADLRLFFKLYGNEVDTIGRVVWIEESGRLEKTRVGIEFAGMNELERMELKSLLSEN